jgi:hypothetical protein
MSKAKDTPAPTVCTSDLDCTSPLGFVGYNDLGGLTEVIPYPNTGAQYLFSNPFICKKHDDGKSYCTQPTDSFSVNGRLEINHYKPGDT